MKSFLFFATLVYSLNGLAVNQKIMSQYVDYIVSVSSLEYNNQELPTVKSVSDLHLLGYTYEPELLLQQEKGEIELAVPVAVYLPSRKQILVSENLDLSDPSSSGPTLVHELVHYLQDINGVTQSFARQHLSCTEGEAYDIQGLWQLENNVRPEEYAFIQQRIMISFMQCEQSYK